VYITYNVSFGTILQYANILVAMVYVLFQHYDCS